MSSLRTVEAKLPPGFRFHPRDEELVCDYLINKYTCCECSLMIEVDLNKCEPWDIPGKFSAAFQADMHLYGEGERCIILVGYILFECGCSDSNRIIHDQ